MAADSEDFPDALTFNHRMGNVIAQLVKSSISPEDHNAVVPNSVRGPPQPGCLIIEGTMLVDFLCQTKDSPQVLEAHLLLP